jgi:hypothetical protein
MERGCRGGLAERKEACKEEHSSLADEKRLSKKSPERERQ